MQLCDIHLKSLSDVISQSGIAHLMLQGDEAEQRALQLRAAGEITRENFEAMAVSQIFLLENAISLLGGDFWAFTDEINDAPCPICVLDLLVNWLDPERVVTKDSFETWLPCAVRDATHLWEQLTR